MLLPLEVLRSSCLLLCSKDAYCICLCFCLYTIKLIKFDIKKIDINRYTKVSNSSGLSFLVFTVRLFPSVLLYLRLGSR